MRNTDLRLRRLEERRRGQRCPTCASWPSIVTFMPPAGDIYGDPVSSHPDLPEQCPRCGWAPIHVQVVFGDDDAADDRPIHRPTTPTGLS